MSIASSYLAAGLFLPPMLAALGAAVVIAGMLKWRHALPMDEPNHRSLHSAPIPRSGGLGIMAGIILGWCAVWWTFGSASGAFLLILALLLSAFSLIDDVRGLSVRWRFALQILLAGMLVAGLGLPDVLPWGAIGLALAVLAVVWMTNLYNFMDGANGLAGGMATFGFGFYALAAFHAGSPAFALAAACIAAAACGFLLFNFDPARIFMGDSGSVPLGFLAAALGLAGWQQGLWPAMFPVLVFSPFIVDASVTLAKRGARGEKVWQAHREHYYQRVIQMGLGHRRTALAEYVLMAACGLGGLAIQDARPVLQWLVVAGFLLAYGVVMVRVDRAWQLHVASNEMG